MTTLSARLGVMRKWSIVEVIGGPPPILLLEKVYATLDISRLKGLNRFS